MFVDQQLSCPNLAIPEYVMRHIVNVESGDNPFAIGVVGGRLERQPKTLEEAVATANMLESKGYNFSLGIAQINRYNLAKFGLSPYEKAFDPCANLKAGAKILADCYASAKGDWDKAFSCYYSGNFVTGISAGYVQKIYNSMSREYSVAAVADTTASGASPLAGSGQNAPGTTKQARQAATDASRLAMRTIPFGAAAQAVVPALPATPAQIPEQAVTQPAASNTFYAQARQSAGDAAQPDVVQLVPSAAQAASAASKASDVPEVDAAFVF